MKVGDLIRIRNDCTYTAFIGVKAGQMGVLVKPHKDITNSSFDWHALVDGNIVYLRNHEFDIVTQQ